MMPTIDFKSLKPVTTSFPIVETQLNWRDYWGAVKVRWGVGRNNYTVTPGLYKVGNPNSQSDVFVSANYKLSFDALRKNLKNMQAWILVIDTKGVNVWCAAAKGTFSTDKIVKSINQISLKNIVSHRNLIVPQLAAVGVAAHAVKESSGFRVIFAPVLAKNLKPFIEAGYKATPEMRKINFPFKERAKLIPVDLMYGKNKLLVILISLFILSGLDKTGFLFARMIETSLEPVIYTLGAYLAGIVFAPLLLPYIPFRAFALKGAICGGAITIVLTFMLPLPVLESLALFFLNVSIASFMTMNFTGSTTFTSLSGVLKEMKWAIPFQIALATAALVLFIIAKLV